MQPKGKLIRRRRETKTRCWIVGLLDAGCPRYRLSDKNSENFSFSSGKYLLPYRGARANGYEMQNYFKLKRMEIGG